MTVYHVAQHARVHGEGTEAAPFHTIGEAAAIARAGDEIVVHAGVYRERVDPRHGGEGDDRRIVYRAADGDRPVITGTEPVTGWRSVGDGVWTATIPNAVFGGFNPFKRTIFGDWAVDPSSHARAIAHGDDVLSPEAAAAGYPDRPARHLAQVYFGDHALYEAFSEAEVRHPAPRTVGFDHGLGANGPVADPPEATMLVWYAEVSGDAADGVTTIWANFGGADPNAGRVEATVRETCFQPSRPQVNYITVRGFELERAASPWAPPTAGQTGLIGTNWSRGWLIEDNLIHDATCSGVSLGKEESTGDNDSTRTRRKSGYQYQMEAVFKALRFGWAKGVVGGHVVRGNVIHDCGQTGIVGHMGGAFGVIERNEIYNVATRREFWGHEIGGIKLHAAIDTVIRANNVHDCTLGMWLDWQTQGTHIDRNVFWRNSRDVMIEVSHGPYTVSDNVFASPIALDVFSDGGAYINNLIAGKLRLVRVLDRSTPYHFPHSTDVAGSAVVYGGDDRFINNLFIQPAGTAPDSDEQTGWRVEGHGTRVYNLQAKRDLPLGSGPDGERPSDVAGYERLARDLVSSADDEERFRDIPQPVFARDNTYVGGARPLIGESGAVMIGPDPRPLTVDVFERDGRVLLTLRVAGSDDAASDAFPSLGEGDVVRTADLGTPRIVEERFERPDGSPFVFDEDITGAPRGERSSRGPIADLRVDEEHEVWEARPRQRC